MEDGKRELMGEGVQVRFQVGSILGIGLFLFIYKVREKYKTVGWFTNRFYFDSV